MSNALQQNRPTRPKATQNTSHGNPLRSPLPANHRSHNCSPSVLSNSRKRRLGSHFPLIEQRPAKTGIKLIEYGRYCPRRSTLRETRILPPRRKSLLPPLLITNNLPRRIPTHRICLPSPPIRLRRRNHQHQGKSARRNK